MAYLKILVCQPESSGMLRDVLHLYLKDMVCPDTVSLLRRLFLNGKLYFFINLQNYKVIVCMHVDLKIVKLPFTICIFKQDISITYHFPLSFCK